VFAGKSLDFLPRKSRRQFLARRRRRRAIIEIIITKEIMLDNQNCGRYTISIDIDIIKLGGYEIELLRKKIIK